MTGMLLLLSALSSFAQPGTPSIITQVSSDTSRSGGIRYFLECRTAEDYTNGSTVLTYRRKRSGMQIMVEFTGTNTPQKVKKSIEPARVRIPLGKLKPGTYHVELVSQIGAEGHHGKGLLEIQATSFSWSLLNPNTHSP